MITTRVGQIARIPLALVAAAALACGGSTPEEPTAAGPVVEREVVDDVEIVRNVSGSEWGEVQLRVVTEIGESDDENYMFAQPMGMWATEDAVYVADTSMGIRAYDRSGQFLRAYGGQGQGPGEYEMAMSTAVVDGRVVAQDFGKLLFYEMDGTFIEQWDLMGSGAYGFSANPMLVGTDGGIYQQVSYFPDGPENFNTSESGFMAVTADGWSGEYVGEPMTSEDWEGGSVPYPCAAPDGRSSECRVSIPFAPGPVMKLHPDLSMVTGSTDRYRLRVDRPDGSAMVIERFEEPVPVTEMELRLYIANANQRVRRDVPGYEFDQNLIPEHKPSYMLTIPSHDGRLLVARQGAGYWQEENCGAQADWSEESEQTNCFADEIYIDIFAGDGRYLGYFFRPNDVRVAFAYFNNDEFWAYGLAEDGNPVVRGYELVIPTDS